MVRSDEMGQKIVEESDWRGRRGGAGGHPWTDDDTVCEDRTMVRKNAEKLKISNI